MENRNRSILVVAIDGTRWRQYTQDPGRAAILLEPDHIVCMKGEYVECYAPDGRLIWRRKLPHSFRERGALGYPGNIAQADDAGAE